MTIAAKLDSVQLEDAFSNFSQVSAQLASSYNTLQDQVVHLTRELAQARSEQQHQLQEKDRLANRLSLLLESLPGGVVVLSGNGIVQECNPAARELLGEPLHGQIWRDVVQRSFSPRPDDGHDISLTGGRRVNLSTCSLGHEPGQILLLKDVTKTRRLQEQISQLKRLSAMGEMAASLAHQIRTPLASALLYTGGLERRKLTQEKRQYYASKLRGVLQHLETLVRDMLAFAHTGNFTLEEVTADRLHTAVQNCLESVAVNTGLSYSITNSAQDIVIRGNLEALVSSFNNLIDNSLQSSDGKVAITVEFSVMADGQLRVRYSDDGPGLPAGIGEQVFEPFMTTRSGGTGLGLAVVRAIVQSHGGAIRLDARQEQGAAFTIELPVTTAVHSNSSPVSDSSTSPAVVDHQLRFKPGQQGNQ